MTEADHRLRWFGPSWGAPINSECAEVAAPIGEPCLWCEETIVEQDQGVMMWSDPDGFHPLHLDCNLRMALGSVDHQQRLARGLPCDECRDDPALTRRAAATAAANYWRLRHPYL